MTNARADDAMKAHWLLVALFALPLGVMLAKLPMLPTSAFWSSFLSLADLPTPFQKIAEDVLLVPLGGLVVVIFRLTLGLRVLGLFRPILIALAFRIVGVPVSLGLLLFALLVIVLLRPMLKTNHSYARIAVLLSLASALLFAPLIAGKWWDIAWLREVALFPVIALCLTCESFAKVLDRAGIREAAWRTITTVSAAVIILGLTSLPGILELFLRFPEMLLLQAGCILLINKHLAFRLFEGKNLFVVQPAQSFDPAAERAISIESRGTSRWTTLDQSSREHRNARRRRTEQRSCRSDQPVRPAMSRAIRREDGRERHDGAAGRRP